MREMTLNNGVLPKMEPKVVAALDDPMEWPAFSRQAQADTPIWDSHVIIEGMHCSACANIVERALKSVPGVLQAEVNGVTRHAVVKWSADSTKPSSWMSAINHAGYGVLPATAPDTLMKRKSMQRLMLWRWLVAGFCMMQVMMYAVPVYVAAPGEMTKDIVHLMRWASWVLTLPVLLFSCRPFFENAWRDIRQYQVSMDLPVSMGILIMFVASSAATFWPHGWWANEVYFDSITMFVFFLLTGRLLETRLRNRTAGALDELMTRLPVSVERQREDGVFEKVSTRRLRQSDIVRIMPGEAFPADGELVDGETLVDEALLTGESRPVKKTMNSELVAGSYNLASPVLMRITKVGEDTRYAQIVGLMEQAATDKPRLAMLADRIAAPFLILVLLASVAAITYWWSTDPARGLMAAIAVLVVTCPCALSLATPTSMLATAGALARRGILTSRLQVLEVLAGIDTVVFDKTGTLTKDRLRVGHIQVRIGWDADRALKLASSIARHSLHPVSRALSAACTESLVQVRNVEEVSGSGLRAETDYGVIRLGSARYCEVDVPDMAKMQVHLADEQGWLATFDLDEDIRDDARKSIDALHKAGYEVRVLSGDRRAAVGRVADELGIVHVEADSTPQHKLSYVRDLQSSGRHVAMIGDGMNDGPVLAGADISITLGQAVPLAQSHSDFVILGTQLAFVPALLFQARRTMLVVRQNLVWAALYNAVTIPLAITGWVNAWIAGLGMALSSLLVILNAARLSNLRG